MKLKSILLLFFLVCFLGLAAYYLFPEQKLPISAQVDSIIVYKSKRELQVFLNGKLLKTYKISLGRQPFGHKEYEGDKRTPEGLYYINGKNPRSGYYKNFGISYPNEKDILHSKQINKPTGGDIKIHGLRNKVGFIGKFHRWFDWTLGCIALTNQEIDELYNHVKIGTPIEIKP